MRRSLTLATTAVLALHACQAVPLPAGVDRKKPAANASAAPAASQAPRPGASASASPAADTLVANALKRPTGQVLALAGTVALDAAYMVAAGAGNIVAAGGGNIVAAGGGNVIPTGGGHVIVNNGGNVIPTGGGHVVSNQGGQIVAAGAGNMVAAGAGNLVAAGGGNLTAPFDAAGNLVAAGAGNLLGSFAGGKIVAAGGGNMVAAGGGNVIPTGGGNLYVAPRFALTQAGTVSAGEQRPVAGALVSVVALEGGRYLPLGVDEQGEPVYAVYTNLLGGWEVFLPAEARGNVAVVVSAAAADARLNYNLVTPSAATAPAAVDEASALAARYLRRALTGRMRFMLQQPEAGRFFLATDQFMRPAASADVGKMIDRLAAIGTEAGVDFAALPDAAADRLAQRLLDACLAGFDLGATPINARDLANWDDDVTVKEGAARPDLPLQQALRGCAWFLIEAAGAKMRATPGYFSQAYLEGVNDAKDGSQAQPLSRSWEGEVRKPADVAEFLLVEYLGTVRPNIRDPLRRLGTDLHTALDAAPAATRAAAPAGVLDLDPMVPAPDRAAKTVQVLMAAGNQLMVEVARRIEGDAALRAALTALVKAEAQAGSTASPAP